MLIKKLVFKIIYILINIIIDFYLIIFFNDFVFLHLNLSVGNA